MNGLKKLKPKLDTHAAGSAKWNFACGEKSQKLYIALNKGMFGRLVEKFVEFFRILISGSNLIVFTDQQADIQYSCELFILSGIFYLKRKLKP